MGFSLSDHVLKNHHHRDDGGDEASELSHDGAMKALLTGAIDEWGELAKQVDGLKTELLHDTLSALENGDLGFLRDALLPLRQLVDSSRARPAEKPEPPPAVVGSQAPTTPRTVSGARSSSRKRSNAAPDTGLREPAPSNPPASPAAPPASDIDAKLGKLLHLLEAHLVRSQVAGDEAALGGKVAAKIAKEVAGKVQQAVIKEIKKDHAAQGKKLKKDGGFARRLFRKPGPPEKVPFDDIAGFIDQITKPKEE